MIIGNNLPQGANVSNIKRKIEDLFDRLGHQIYRHRYKTLLIMLAVIGMFVSQTVNLTLDTSFEGMLHDNDSGRIAYNNFRDQFGQDRIIVLAVRSENIFDEIFLKKLKALHTDLENEVPHVHEVNSLINARSTRGEGDVLLVDDLFKDWPEKQIDLAVIKTFVLNNPVYLNDYITEDGRITAILVESQAVISEIDDDDLIDDFDDDFDAVETDQKQSSKKQHYISEKENKEVVEAVYRIVDRYRADDFSIAITGGPVVEEVYNRITEEDMFFFTVLMLIIVALFLAGLFRRISGVIFPMLIVYSALLSTMGIMAFCNVALSIFSVVLPSFIMAVGMADSVHILAIFYRKLQQDGNKENAIAFSLSHSGLAIVMTSFTTIAGLLSFSMSELSSIGHLGIFASVGVFLALLYTIFLLPTFLAIIPIKLKRETGKQKRTSTMDRVLIFFAVFSTTHPKKIVAGSILLFAVSVFFIFQLEFSHHLKKFFPDTMAVKQDLNFIDEEFRGIGSIEVVLDTKKENGLYNPELLSRIETISREVETIDTGDIYVGKVRSINDILKEINQALHENNPEFYNIPQDRDIIAQEFFLFENSGADDLEKIVDSQFSKTRVSVKIPWVEVLLTDKFVRHVHDRFDAMFSDIAEVTTTGMSVLMGKTVAASIRSMTKSYIVAFAVITIMMILLVGDIRIGLLSMIPNLLPIITIMGIMGATGSALDMNSLMIGSIAIGLVVDDTMHFMYNFRRYYDLTKDAGLAVRETLLGTGRALLITSLVLSANFFTLMFATLGTAFIFGMYTGFVIIAALLADFVLAPALMMLVTRKEMKTRH